MYRADVSYRQQRRVKIKKAFWISVFVFDAIALAILIWFLYIYPNTAPKVGAMPQPAFSHENCQYPDRDSNPPDGCDNSDPCDPSTKDGKCKDDPSGIGYDPNFDPQTGTTRPPASITPEPVPIQPTPQPVTSCGGK